MTDLLIVPPAEFYKHKDRTIDHAFVDKYKELFSKYNCFSENAVVIIQSAATTNVNKQKKYPHNLNIKREQKSLKKQLLGILNVINEDNYKKMLLKTKILITSDNLKEVFTEILDKCVCQIFYLSIYSAFIKDLMASLSDIERQMAVNIVNEFVKDFMNQSYIIKVAKTENAYHDFCSFQKAKMQILSKNMIILDFLNNSTIIAATTINTYGSIIFKAFMDNIDTNTDVADVLLQMILEISKYDNTFFDREALSLIKTTNKLQFMIDAVLKIGSV